MSVHPDTTVCGPNPRYPGVCGCGDGESAGIERGEALLRAYVDQNPTVAGWGWGNAITGAIADLLACADNHAWRFCVEQRLLNGVLRHVDGLAAAE